MCSNLSTCMNNHSIKLYTIPQWMASLQQHGGHDTTISTRTNPFLSGQLFYSKINKISALQ